MAPLDIARGDYELPGTDWVRFALHALLYMILQTPWLFVFAQLVM